MSEQILSCPFCGGTNPEVFPVLNDDAPINPMYCIGCLDCDCGTGEENTIEDAKKAWNRRAEPKKTEDYWPYKFSKEEANKMIEEVNEWLAKGGKDE